MSSCLPKLVREPGKPGEVTGPGGTSAPLGFSYSGVGISAVSPLTGPTKGGNTVTVTGSGFTGTTAATFGATPAAFHRRQIGKDQPEAFPAAVRAL